MWLLKIRCSGYSRPFLGLPPYTRKIGLPDSRVVYTVLRSPHIDKKSREQFQMETKKELLVVKTDRHELRKKFFWLKRQRMFGAQFEITVSYKTRLDKAFLSKTWNCNLSTSSFHFDCTSLRGEIADCCPPQPLGLPFPSTNIEGEPLFHLDFMHKVGQIRFISNGLVLAGYYPKFCHAFNPITGQLSSCPLNLDHDQINGRNGQLFSQLSPGVSSSQSDNDFKLVLPCVDLILGSGCESQKLLIETHSSKSGMWKMVTLTASVALSAATLASFPSTISYVLGY